MLNGRGETWRISIIPRVFPFQAQQVSFIPSHSKWKSEYTKVHLMFQHSTAATKWREDDVWTRRLSYTKHSLPSPSPLCFTLLYTLIISKSPFKLLKFIIFFSWSDVPRTRRTCSLKSPLGEVLTTLATDLAICLISSISLGFSISGWLGRAGKGRVRRGEARRGRARGTSNDAQVRNAAG